MSKMTISPTLHEENIKMFYPKGSESDPVLDRMRDAVAFARTTTEKTFAAYKAIMLNQMETPLRNKKTARETAMKNMEGVTPKFDEIRKVALTEVEQLDKQTREPLAPRRELWESQVAGETRATLRAMDDKQRADVIEQMLQDMDERGLSAVLNAPPYLSGLKSDHQAMILETYRGKKFPQEMRRIETLKRATEKFDQVGRVFIDHLNGLVPADELREAEEAEQAAKQALAS